MSPLNSTVERKLENAWKGIAQLERTVRSPLSSYAHRRRCKIRAKQLLERVCPHRGASIYRRGIFYARADQFSAREIGAPDARKFRGCISRLRLENLVVKVLAVSMARNTKPLAKI